MNKITKNNLSYYYNQKIKTPIRRAVGYLRSGKIGQKIVELIPFRALAHPLESGRTRKKKALYVVASILANIPTLGMLKVGYTLYEKKIKPSRVKKEEFPFVKKVKIQTVNGEKEVQVVQDVKTWKTYPPAWQTEKEFEDKIGFKKPEINPEILKGLPTYLKVKVQERCLSEMKESVNALDMTIADTINEMVCDGKLPETLGTLNEMTRRLLEFYKAYVQALQNLEYKEIPLDVGLIKASGFTHQEILDFQPTFKRYFEIVDPFMEQLSSLIPEEKPRNKLFLELVKRILPSADGNLDELLKNFLDDEKIKVLFDENKEGEVKDLLVTFCRSLAKDKEDLYILKRFDQRIDFAKTFKQKEKEDFKRKIAEMLLIPISKRKSVDELLLNELRQRFEWRDFEPGSVGNIFRFKNILEGKVDEESPDSFMRTKLFFLYGSKNIANEVGRYPELLKEMNRILEKSHESDNLGWQIDSQFIDLARNRNEQDPIFSLGRFANANWRFGQTREYLTLKEIEEKKLKDPNLTWKEAQDLALKKEGLSREEYAKRFRFPLYSPEYLGFLGNTKAHDSRERKTFILGQISDKLEEISSDENVDAIDHFMGLLSEKFDERHKDEVKDKIKEKLEALKLDSDLRESIMKLIFPDRSEEYSGARFDESSLEYFMRNEKINWAAGKYFYEIKSPDESTHPFVKGTTELGSPRMAGISGSSDQMFNILGALGIQSYEQMMELRMLYLPWMIRHDDHSAVEILIGLKSFHLPFKLTVEYYKDIYPSNPEFLKLLETEHKRRNFELPDFYLSDDYVKTVIEEEKCKLQETKASEEAKNAQRVEELQKNMGLFAKTIRIYKGDYTPLDPFGNKKFWSTASGFSKERIDKINQERAKKRQIGKEKKSKVTFKMNEEKGMYEKYDRPKNPFYKGTQKDSLSLVPPSGKFVPYVMFDNPDQNRVGLLFDENYVQFKTNRFVFSSDAHLCAETRWKREYSKSEIGKENFEERLKEDSEEDVKFMKETAHQIPFDELKQHMEAHNDEFTPYNEIYGSISGEGIIGVFCYSKGLPVRKKGDASDHIGTKNKFLYKPLDHEKAVDFKESEDYDRYMRVLTIGKKLLVREKFGKEVPVYEINQTKDQGMKMIPREDLIRELEEILADEKMLKGIVKIAAQQSTLLRDNKQTRALIRKEIERYLNEL